MRSDWVRAAASIGQSRQGVLVHAGLDSAIPDDPFGSAHRYDLVGLTSRTIVDGWYDTVDALGERTNRINLRRWMMLGKKDEAGQAQWLAAHPDDPLALHAAKKAGAGQTASVSPSRRSTPKAMPAIVTERTEPVAEIAEDTAEAMSIFSLQAAPVWVASAGIIAMLGFAGLFASPPDARISLPEGAIYAQSCPVGTMPANLFPRRRGTLQHPPIIDDTSDPLEDGTAP